MITHKITNTYGILCLVLIATAAKLAPVSEPTVWVFIGITSALVALYVRIYETPVVASLILSVLVFRIFLAYFDAHIAILPQADKDPLMFHYDAILYLEGIASYSFINGSALFKIWLSIIYEIFGASLFAGNSFSAIVSVVGLILFSKCLQRLETRFQALFILGYALLPASNLFFVLTMREAYQTTIILLFLFLFISACKNNDSSVRYYFLTFCALFLLPLFHVKALYIYTIIVSLGLCVFIYFRFDRESTHEKRICYPTVNVLFTGIIIWFKGPEFLLIVNGYSPYIPFELENEVIASLRSTDVSGVIAGLNEYISAVTGGGDLATETKKEIRTSFPVQLDTDNILTFALTAPIVFLEYMFMPFFWQIGTAIDVFPVLEALLRLAMVVYILMTLYKLRLFHRDINNYWIWIFLMMAYFALCGIWTLGTTNFGQAFRHHVLSNPIIIICFASIITSRSMRKN